MIEVVIQDSDSVYSFYQPHPPNLNKIRWNSHYLKGMGHVSRMGKNV